LDDEFKVTDPVVVTSSRSSQLDELAIQLVRGATIKPAKSDGPRLAEVVIPVEFMRDSASALDRRAIYREAVLWRAADHSRGRCLRVVAGCPA